MKGSQGDVRGNDYGGGGRRELSWIGLIGKYFVEEVVVNVGWIDYKISYLKIRVRVFQIKGIVWVNLLNWE